MSSIGIYAATAYGVGQRTQEIGVRIALGAGRADILWLILKQGLLRIGIGLIVGLIAGLGAGRLLAVALVNMSASDPATFISIAVLLAAVTMLACFIPARRAMRLDPVDALRDE